VFPIAGRDTSTIPLAELAKWLARCGGITPDRVPHIEAYVAHFLSKKAYNPAAIEGQQRMKKASTRTAKRARTKASAQTVTAEQLDRELAAARPPSPPPDPAASAAWHQNNGLAVPNHLATEPGLTHNTRGRPIPRGSSRRTSGNFSTGSPASAGSVHRRPYGRHRRHS
jgi:hypothetical protein